MWAYVSECVCNNITNKSGAGELCVRNPSTYPCISHSSRASFPACSSRPPADTRSAVRTRQSSSGGIAKGIFMFIRLYDCVTLAANIIRTMHLHLKHSMAGIESTGTSSPSLEQASNAPAAIERTESLGRRLGGLNKGCDTMKCAYCLLLGLQLV